MTPSRLTWMPIVASLLTGGCLSSIPHEEEHPAHAGQHAHWAYEGHAGPHAWGELDGTYQACAAGRAQSPIDLSPGHAAAAPVPAVDFHYAPLQATEINNGHTIQDNLPAGGYVELGGARYDLAQFHFHSPSEHTLDGKHFPLEIHLVHKNAAGALLVLGILVEQGADNPALHALFSKLPHGADTVSVTIDPATLLPPDHHVVTYPGSLTTPPCTEGVTWRVFTTPVHADAEELHAFQALYAHNSRPTMPLNGRVVVHD